MKRDTMSRFGNLCIDIKGFIGSKRDMMSHLYNSLRVNWSDGEMGTATFMMARGVKKMGCPGAVKVGKCFRECGLALFFLRVNGRRAKMTTRCSL